MLERVLEPEVMDTPEDALDYDRMDHRQVNARFVDDLLAHAPNLEETLDLGTGTAQIPIELCRRCETARVVAVDLAGAMLELAYLNVELAGLRDRIRLDQGDAKRLDYPDGQFTAVISNSIVHHLPEPLAALREGWRTLRPGGVALFRDLLRPDDEETLARLVACYAAGCNANQRSLFAASLRAALTLAEVRELVQEIGGDPAAVQATSDRHWTWVQQKAVQQ